MISGTSGSSRGWLGLADNRRTTWVGGLRNKDEWSDGIIPILTGRTLTTGVPINYPGGTVTTLDQAPTNVQGEFHNFPCSKCHNPHASRLPRLMITNCLDVSHNTWDDGSTYDPSGWTAASNYTASDLAYSPTAHNCHRWVGSTDTDAENGAESGWNSITPW